MGQKFACSIKDQIVDKVEEIKTKTSNIRINSLLIPTMISTKTAVGKLTALLRKVATTRADRFVQQGSQKRKTKKQNPPPFGWLPWHQLKLPRFTNVYRIENTRPKTDDYQIIKSRINLIINFLDTN